MMAVDIQIYSIQAIEGAAGNAFAEGKPATANPYLLGTVAHRVWALQFERCQRPGGKVCSYPKCNCPFDAPSDPTWCARNLPRHRKPEVQG